MVGGGKGRKEDPLVINSTNVFAALGSLKKKKKKGSEKENLGSSSKTKGMKGLGKEAEKKEVFWAPSPLKVKSWADVDEEDDDDYYASMAPPGSAWGIPKGPEPVLEESESEEDGLDEVDDDVEEHENETATQAEMQPVISKPPEPSPVNKEEEKTLSKKELKKKGLEELNAVLAELGYAKPQTGGPDDSQGAEQGKKPESNVKFEMKEGAPSESKNAKKKKKKDKSSKEAKESSQGPPKGTDAGNVDTETGETKKPEEPSPVDVKEKLKKVVPAKKKKSSKEMDAAARAAANEAAARSARLAAAKKKEKNHYNQQPVR
ncbi:dnaJ-like protein subfamily C GRV2-like isoform X1 [Hibiscus syriacus]|uniref:DnaJ-like protein subfamily C GRV2-like isoform X1 n=1 Tax=Hibiscus syriacus TaxID=106335 RepID=A0A6A2X7S6_HIBSY|nr:nucleolin-like [Hibiscus syriacus]KAE8671403.1 dnaJ-like protein subfamily C GRV2-like isoform X1 [Hibiscus syriacus]